MRILKNPLAVLILFGIAVLLHIAIHYSPSSPNGSGQATQTAGASLEETKEQFYISYDKPGRNGVLSDYDATDQLLFLSYSEKNSVVDGYDLDGNFVFSLHFDAYSKGTTMVRCQNGLLYVRTKQGSVFVFDRDKFVFQLGEAEAQTEGYTYTWFSEQSHTVKLKGLSFWLLDGQGSPTAPIPVPTRVILDYYKTYCILVAICIVITGSLLVSYFRNRKRHTGECGSSV